MMAPTPTSSLAANHPDHPKLADLGLTPSDPHSSPSGHGGITTSSPVQTTTPTSMSDVEDPSSPPNASQSGQAPSMMQPGGLTEGPNARSKTITSADGDDTFGALNCHPVGASGRKQQLGGLKGTFRVGVSEDRNKRCRRTMEDAHSFVYDYGGIRGQGYFAVFDGHAGKHAAEWCGQNFHEYLLDAIVTQPEQPVPDLLNKTFHVVDSRLSQLAQAGKTQSGCTAVTAFLRVEPADDNEQPRGFLNPGITSRGLMEGRGEEELEAQTAQRAASGNVSAGTSGSVGGAGANTGSPGGNGEGSTLGRKMSGRKIRDFVKNLTSSSDNKERVDEEDPEPMLGADGSRIEAIEAKSDKSLKRVLYTANVGDARAVLCRGGKAVRLTYDHKGSDQQEAKRITDAGGFVMNNRVNGVLAVTRSLGDASMKEFVVGSPYTTETVLDEQDEFLIVACDGLWDVCEDQDAVDIIRNISDAQDASKRLLDHAITNYSTDNLSVMVIRFHQK